MNFLIEPNGELVLNAKMDEIELGVLQPAVGKLLANCPLFCVDKAGQPGEKQCIAVMKAGGKNACIG
jgi:hypothetical protein